MASRGVHPVLLNLSPEDCATLERWVRRGSTAQALALRARIGLACADRSETAHGVLAAELGVHRATVCVWRNRFAARRLAGLQDDPRVGASRLLQGEVRDRLNLGVGDVAGVPTQGSSSWPSSRFVANRSRHSPTVCRVTTSSAASSPCDAAGQSAQARTVRARGGSACAGFGWRANRSRPVIASRVYHDSRPSASAHFVQAMTK